MRQALAVFFPQWGLLLDMLCAWRYTVYAGVRERQLEPSKFLPADDPALNAGSFSFCLPPGLGAIDAVADMYEKPTKG